MLDAGCTALLEDEDKLTKQSAFGASRAALLQVRETLGASALSLWTAEGCCTILGMGKLKWF